MPTRGAGATRGTGAGDGERIDEGVGVGARAGVGVPARGGAGVVPRGGVSGGGAEEVFTDAEGGGRGERVRRVIGVVKVGEGDDSSESEDVDGWLADESERGSSGGVPVAVVGRGEGIADVLRGMRAGRSGTGADIGVFRSERVDSSGVLLGDATINLPSTCSGAAGVLRAERGGTSVPLTAGRDALGAGARIGTCGGTFSRGFATRSASRIKRKSRPNS